jgi:hypothetical protein
MRQSTVDDPKSTAIQRLVVTGALTLMLVALWAVMHRHQGIALDGKLYAVQAMARVNPALAVDVYLANTSQDRYTFFSPIYAAVIARTGLESAELSLFILCTVWFLVAAWFLARELSTAEVAWLAAALLVITTGYYGASTILHYSETYLTARSLAEALVVTSLACHFGGRWRIAILFSVGAFLIHPLMALPGFLLLIGLRFPVRQVLIGAGAGVLAIFIVALADLNAPPGMRFLTLVDAPWLDMIRQRSQFLFFEYWTLDDWQINARPLLSLAVTAIVIEDERIRRLCATAMTVGVAGLAVAFIASNVGPVAMLLEGQAWRWMWITSFVGVLLLAPTALAAWSDEKCGTLCACLLISSWVFPAIPSAGPQLLALVLWSLRSHISPGYSRHLRWAAAMFVLIAVVWAIGTAWSGLASPLAESGRDPKWIADIRAVCGLQIPALMLVGLFWYGIKVATTSWRAALAGVVAMMAALILPGSLKQVGSLSTGKEIQEFADWRDAVPATSSVLVAPTGNSASFVWFTLGRPSYMSVDQSAGVVFSHATAVEIRRRSEVLLPISDPVWQLLKLNLQTAHGKKPQQISRPLTSNALIEICGDPQLGFVVARENLGFDPIRHTHAGPWKDWNLYDCRRVRSGPAAS